MSNPNQEETGNNTEQPKYWESNMPKDEAKKEEASKPEA